MEIYLETTNPVPLYQQLVDQLRRQITLGILEPGSKLPTVRELAVLTRVNRNTAARAIQVLEADGLVNTRVGRGTFVAEDARERTRTALEGALNKLLDRTIREAAGLGAPIETLPRRLQARIDLGEDPEDLTPSDTEGPATPGDSQEDQR